MNKRDKKRLARSGKLAVKLHVLGAAGGVTGSLNLVEVFDKEKTTRFLLDVGLHLENERADRESRLPRGIKAADIDFCIISHAHIDHSGYLPKLIKEGFKGPAYVTEATADLLAILLPDSGYLQEEAAKRKTNRARKLAESRQAQSERKQAGKNKGNFKNSGKNPRSAVKQENAVPAVQPLYTQEEARYSLKFLKALSYDEKHELSDNVALTFTDAGHILGSAVVNLEIGNGSEKRTLCFSGNIGRPDMPVISDLKPVEGADFLIVESTYGNRAHQKRDRLEHLASVLNEACKRARIKDPRHGSGVILIPAFAVGRAQAVLDDLRQLMEAGRIPSLQVYLDGRMSVSATAVHRKHTELLNEKTRQVVENGGDPFATPRFATCVEWTDSARLQEPQDQPIIIVGSSGMANGGRIVSHLEKRLSGKQNTVIFIGYQGTGTLGHSLVRFASELPSSVDGARADSQPKTVNIGGKPVKVRAKVEFLSDYSAHADYLDTVAWLRRFKRKPKNTLVVHGDSDALQGMKDQIVSRLGWNVVIPAGRDTFDL